MLYRIARTGINGMGIFPSALIVEVTIVATGSHGMVGNTQHGLHLALHVQRVFCRFGDAYMPVIPLRILTTYHDLSANLHHIIMDAVRLQQTSHHIAAIALRDSAEVHLVAQLQETIHLLGCRQLLMLETKAPRIHQRCHGDIKGTIRLFADRLCQLIYLVEHLAALHGRVAAIDTCYGTLRVEHRELTIHLHQFGLYLLLQVPITLIRDIIDSTKHKIGILPILLLGTGNEQQQTASNKK